MKKTYKSLFLEIVYMKETDVLTDSLLSWDTENQEWIGEDREQW